MVRNNMDTTTQFFLNPLVHLILFILFFRILKKCHSSFFIFNQHLLGNRSQRCHKQKEVLGNAISV